MNTVRNFSSVLILLLMIAVGVFGFCAFAEEEAASFDSFAVKEEYIETAQSFQLIELMKEQYPELDESVDYAVRYDAIIAEFTIKDGGFKQALANNQVVLSDEYFTDYPTLYVPIVDTDTSDAVVYAKIVYSNDQYTVDWENHQGELFTKEYLDTKFGATSVYTLIVLDSYYLNLQKILYCQQANTVYPYQYSFFSLQEKSYTPAEYWEYLEEQQQSGSKTFWRMILPGALYYALSFVLIPIAAIFLVTLVAVAVGWLVIRRRKKQKTAENAPSSEE